MRVATRLIGLVVVVGTVAWIAFSPQSAPPTPAPKTQVPTESAGVRPMDAAPVRVTPPPLSLDGGPGDETPKEDPKERFEDVDWRQRGLEYVAKTHPGNDLGHRTVLEVLRRFIDNDCQMRSVSHGAPPTAESLERDTQINATGRKLPTDERVRLQAVIVDYADRKRRANEALFITSKICESRAILAGDYESHPQVSPDADNSKVLLQATEAARKHFDNPLDENMTTLPGADSVTYRVIVLKPQTSPEYIALRQYLRRIRAEESVALRTFFLPESSEVR